MAKGVRMRACYRLTLREVKLSFGTFLTLLIALYSKVYLHTLFTSDLSSITISAVGLLWRSFWGIKYETSWSEPAFRRVWLALLLLVC